MFEYKKFLRQTVLFGTLLSASAAQASTASENLLHQYASQTSIAFDAALGRRLWYSESAGRSCTSCHGNSLKTSGKHVRTGKKIEPMAPSVNPERLTDERKIRKWLLRNCKWTFERECTAEEKGHLVKWLSEN